MDDFLRWAAEIGITDAPFPDPTGFPTPPSPSCLGQSLVLADFPEAGGRGLAAARELMRGEMVLRVPRAALLTRENVLKDENLAACAGRHSYLTPTQILTICLLTEVGKGSDSWWYPYLAQLPRSYDMLCTFTQFEILAFQVDDAIWDSEKAVSKVKYDWKQAIPLMQEMKLRPQLLTFKSWLWASGTVSSRALHVPWDCAGCLCPVGDFFNYDAPDGKFCSEDLETSCSQDTSMVKSDDLIKKPGELDDLIKKPEELDNFSQRLTDGGYEGVINAYCFYARKRYKKGDQVLLSYGTYTNLELLEHYGFLLDSNPNDKAFILLEAAIQTSWPKDSLYIHQNGKPSFSLLSALRLWATPQKHRKAIAHLAYSGLRLSVENELSVMQFIKKSCQCILGELPSSAEDDELLLDIIDKMLMYHFSVDSSASLSCTSELTNFFRAKNLQNWQIANSSLPVKVRRSLERWRLAVQWRLIYKKMLLSSISYCNEVTDRLSSLHFGR